MSGKNREARARIAKYREVSRSIAKRSRRDREEIAKRSRRDREEIVKRSRRDREASLAITAGSEGRLQRYHPSIGLRKSRMVPTIRWYRTVQPHGNKDVSWRDCRAALAELVARPPTAGEVTMAEAIARALTNVMAEKKALRAAWKGGESVSRTLLVETNQDEIEVTLGAPYMRAPVVFDATHDIMADLAALARQARKRNR